MLNLKRRSLPALLLEAGQRYNKRKAFSLIGEEGESNWYTYAEAAERALGLNAVLRRLGVQTGDRVVLFAENRPEWPISYFAISLAGGVIVPVLTDFLAEHLGSVSEHSGAKVVCASEKMMPKLKEAGLTERLPVVLLDTLDEKAVQVLQNGERKSFELDSSASWYQPAEDDLAAILYTSGTTGNSKGVMLSHKNIIFDAIASRSIIKMYTRDRFLSVLPLAHSYECTIGMIIPVLNGSSVVYLDRPPSPAALLPALKAIKPTIMLTVPMIMEKIYRGKVGPALENHPLYKVKLTRRIAERVAGRKLMGTFGGALRFFGVGGAPLAPEVEAFLKNAGFPYAIGYGLTETAPLLAGAPPFKTVLRSTGPALEGVELRIMTENGEIVAGVGAEHGEQFFVDGEIQARGPNVMLGYYKDPERTKEVFTDDGWFKTGDIGCFDEKGRLFIRGRFKAMILGPSGENIYPEEIENILNASDLVEESLVYEGEKGELVALVVLTEKAKTLMAAAGDMAGNAMRAIGDAAHGAAQGMQNAAQGAMQGMQNAMNDAVQGMQNTAHDAGEMLSKLKAAANKRLASFSRLHKVEEHPEPFEKTATRKIKRFLYQDHKK